MLDMGFIHDVRRIIAMLPQKRQTLLFSATMPPEIQKLASSILSRPVKVEVTPVATTADRIEQRVFFVEKAGKRGLLERVLRDRAIQRAIVFTRTKHGANRVAEQLSRASIGAVAIHGNKSQGARERALSAFKEGTTRVLVATDIAARGIDIDGISHVINYDLPNIPESYVHRIGRTARAGASGVAFSFCDSEERAYLADIERLIRMRLPVETLLDEPARHAPAGAATEQVRAEPPRGRGAERSPQPMVTRLRAARPPQDAAPRSHEPARPQQDAAARSHEPARPLPAAPQPARQSAAGGPARRRRRWGTLS
jgi:ATP-dependent RNA helicase RhlE